MSPIILIVWLISRSEYRKVILKKKRGEIRKYRATISAPESRGSGKSSSPKYRIRSKPDASGYVKVKAPDHPIATKNGWLSLHRAIMYDHMGEGQHKCHWCGAVIVWVNRDPAKQFQLIQVDHLNSIASDNRLINLVLSCKRCNTGRSSGYYGHEAQIRRIRSVRRGNYRR